LKRVVDSIKPEYEDKIHFRIADLSTDKGRSFALYHQVGSVTLMLFADGKRLTSLQGEQTPEFLKRAFNRAFK